MFKFDMKMQKKKKTLKDDVEAVKEKPLRQPKKFFKKHFLDK